MNEVLSQARKGMGGNHGKHGNQNQVSFIIH
jgi:hypothetical protein